MNGQRGISPLFFLAFKTSSIMVGKITIFKEVINMMEKIFKAFNVISLVIIAICAVVATFMAFTGICLNEGYTTTQAIPYAIGLDIGTIVYIIADVRYLYNL